METAKLFAKNCNVNTTTVTEFRLYLKNFLRELLGLPYHGRTLPPTFANWKPDMFLQVVLLTQRLLDSWSKLGRVRGTLTPLVHGDNCSSFLKRYLRFGMYLGVTGVTNRERPNCCLHHSTSLQSLYHMLQRQLGTECKTVFLQLPCRLKNTVMRVEDSCQCYLREEKIHWPLPSAAQLLLCVCPSLCPLRCHIFLPATLCQLVKLPLSYKLSWMKVSIRLLFCTALLLLLNEDWKT